LGIEQSDMRGQRVEDGGLLGGLAVPQLFLRARNKNVRPSRSDTVSTSPAVSSSSVAGFQQRFD
jgi:hypothetical protein